MTSEVDFDEVVGAATVPVLVDFWAAWCGPCRAVAPDLEKLAEQRKGQLLVAKVDTEALGTVAVRFAIRSIPTLVLFRGGLEARRISGAMSAGAMGSALGL